MGITIRDPSVNLMVSAVVCAFELVVGILGVAFSKKAEKGALCFILGIIIIVFQVGSVIYGSLRDRLTVDMILTLVAGPSFRESIPLEPGEICIQHSRHKNTSPRGACKQELNRLVYARYSSS